MNVEDKKYLMEDLNIIETDFVIMLIIYTLGKVYSSLNDLVKENNFLSFSKNLFLIYN